MSGGDAAAARDGESGAGRCAASPSSNSSPSPDPCPEGEGRYCANPARGEAAITIAGETLVLRPSFAALVAAEQEIGPLFDLVARAAAGRLALGEMVALFWHCLAVRPEGLTRDRFGEAVAAGGLAAATPALKVLIRQILAGR